MPYDFVRSTKDGVEASLAGVYDFMSNYIIVRVDIIQKGSKASDALSDLASLAYKDHSHYPKNPSNLFHEIRRSRDKVRERTKKILHSYDRPAWVTEVYDLAERLKKKPSNGG